MGCCSKGSIFLFYLFFFQYSDNSRRVSCCHTGRWNVSCNNAPCADHTAVSQGYSLQNQRIAAYKAVLANDYRRCFYFVPVISIARFYIKRMQIGIENLDLPSVGSGSRRSGIFSPTVTVVISPVNPFSISASAGRSISIRPAIL